MHSFHEPSSVLARTKPKLLQSGGAQAGTKKELQDLVIAIQSGNVAMISRCCTRPPVPTNSTIKAAAINKIPESMKASR